MFQTTVSEYVCLLQIFILKKYMTIGCKSMFVCPRSHLCHLGPAWPEWLVGPYVVSACVN